jgi:hypothetical protein
MSVQCFCSCDRKSFCSGHGRISFRCTVSFADFLAFFPFLSTSNRLFICRICAGVNGVTEWGNPTLHGEIAAINNCSRMFQEEAATGGETGVREGLGGGQVWKDLTIYSTAEPCPMVCPPSHLAANSLALVHSNIR